MQVWNQIIDGTGNWILTTSEVQAWEDKSHVARHLSMEGVCKYRF